MTLSEKSILLCFDQFESIYERFKDPDILIAFFDTLVRICNETPNALLLLMVQSAVWSGSIEQHVQRSALDRIEYRESLKTPTIEQLEDLIALRLKPIYIVHPNRPENKIFPFTREYIEKIGVAHGWNPRSVLKVLEQIFNRIKEEQSIEEVIGTEVPTLVLETESNKPVEVFIEEQFSMLTNNYSDDINENPFSNREDFIEAGLFDLFNSLKKNDKKIHEFLIKDVVYKKKKKDLDMVLTVVDDKLNSEENWGLEISNAENHTTLGTTLKNIQNLLQDNKIQKFILIRDSHLPIKKTWKKTNEVIESIQDKGKIIYIDNENSANLVAYKEILDSISAGDMQFQNKSIDKESIDNFMLNKILPKLSAVESIFTDEIDLRQDYIRSKLSKDMKIKTKIPSQDIESTRAESILQIVDTQILVNMAKIFTDYYENKDEYIKEIENLATQNKILIVSKDQSQYIITKAPMENYF